ncbi:MAG: metallophosphoesterase [Balneolaceae bacterium]|nr:metallophosphoesterase [Balneolaceae bacterium]
MALRSWCVAFLLLIFSGCSQDLEPLGQNEILRTYTEFADGTHRGMYDPVTGAGGYPDEEYDATTAMVINWHRLPEMDSSLDARLRYRLIHPPESEWMTAEGESMEFWYRDERVNRVVLTHLNPGSVYEFKVREAGERFRFRTMPSSLEERTIKIVMTSDHQSPDWNQFAHDNARMAALHKPDMFVVAGDFVNDEGRITSESANRWVTYLDYLYGFEGGYFIYDKEIDGKLFENLIIPHVSILGNHETGDEHHIRWPADLYSSRMGYPEYVASNWMQLLFHWPFSSEGFYSEFNPDHPNINPEHVRDGFGKGGFGKLSFSDYLLLIGLDNSQNWEGEPEAGLKDREGNLITDRWPWYETHHSEVRQDLWLKNLLEPENGPSAGETYAHIIPVWHRGLFGTVRQNMTYKNRTLLKYWLPVLYRNGVKLIKEGHDHSFTRTIPMQITTERPENTIKEKIPYVPTSWTLPGNLSREYVDGFFSINGLKGTNSDDIIGWEYDGNFITYDPEGMIAIGHGGWAAGRRDPGGRGGGNAGLWFVDEEKGGESFGGEESFHISVVELAADGLTVTALHPDQLPAIENGEDPEPIHTFRWSQPENAWLSYDRDTGEWKAY